MTILSQLQQALKPILEPYLEQAAQLGVKVPHTWVSEAADKRFGDYQCNIAMILAKPLKQSPRDLGGAIMNELNATGIESLAELSLAGPGFINFTITAQAWEQQLQAVTTDEHLGVEQAAQPKTIVVDFSAPNVAKPMHVGHIRSTIIGESLSRIASYLGHNVIKDNHIGDWGTQFGMILYAWKHDLDEAALEQDSIKELLRIYQKYSLLCKEDAEILAACKEELVKLQQGDAENLEIWKRCLELSKQGLNQIYDRLDVSFDYWLGESFYNDELSATVQLLVDKGLARESQGAIAVFSSEDKKNEQDCFKIHKDGEWRDNPMLIQKSDGGYNYATTDLATLFYREAQWSPDEIWYVVDSRQSLHFKQLFEIAQRLDFKPKLKHIAFGTILGQDKKPFKTRSGETPQLASVLDESIERAAQVIADKNPDLQGVEKDQVSQMVGIGAVKFTELSQHRLTDYIFSWEKMLALQGDTAPYLQYSLVRIQSIFRKLEGEYEVKGVAIKLNEAAEIRLGSTLCQFAERLPQVLDDHRPNLLALYLLDLAKAFHSFFEACPVLKSQGETQASRLALCALTQKVLNQGLSLLSIEAPERM
mgnify:CR=1 FL=1